MINLEENFYLTGKINNTLFQIVTLTSFISLEMAIICLWEIYVTAKNMLNPSRKPTYKWTYKHLYYSVKTLFDRIKRFWENKRGVGMGAVIGIALALIIVAYIVPISFLAIADANKTGWNAAVTTMFQTVLPIIAVIAIVYKFVGRK